MAKVCCVCNEPKESKDNIIFSCKGQGCDVSVHQGCYGIVAIPTGQWFCRKCESQERAARVRCELCPRKEGALKRTDSGGWAHVACALYIPEVVFGNNRIMEPIITSKLPRERFSKSCYICEERGNETQATYGACMSCHKPSCRLAFHVTCAQRELLLCEEEDSRDSRNVIYCGYCSTHHKKMLRQKHKQALHKPTLPPSTSGSSLYPATPTSSLTTPLSSLSNLGPSDGGHKLERTRSGSPLKGAAKHERQSEPPMKRSSTDSSASKPKRRRRKPSSSNESTTSEAPSNGSEFSLIPQAHVIPSASPLLAPGLPLSLPGTGKGGYVEGGRGQKGIVVKQEQILEARGDNFATSTAHPGEMAGDGRVTSSSSSSIDQNSRIQAPPPRSLQELLERQWEQTAQFILDQAGKQNNAGSMLAHLHTLQSDNRQMQSRIMELASQREFYIAINTKLRQTLTEHELGHLPNGVQPVGNGLQLMTSGSGGGGGEEAGNGIIVPMEVAEHKPHPSRHAHQPYQSSREEGPPPPQFASQPPLLSKEDQDIFLRAHFSPSTASGVGGEGSSSGAGLANNANSAPLGVYSPSSKDKTTPSSLRYTDSCAEDAAPGSNFIPTLTQISMATPAQYTPLDATPLSHPILEYPPPPSNSLATSVPQQQDPTLHEITQVTNSVHAPISSLTPLPNDGGSSEGYGGNPTTYKKELNRR